MSSSITITDEQIAEIANRMADEGQTVSPLAIWSEVHTGSVVGVAASLRKWREERTRRVPQVVERPALPETVTDTMREALDRLWTSAQDEAERSVARRLGAMRQRVDDACTERDDALAELQNTVQELDTLQGQLEHMTRAHDAKVDAVAGLEEDIALAVQRTDVAEKRAQELVERVAALEAELERALSELAAEREARAREEADAAHEGDGATADLDGEAERAALVAEHSEAVSRLESELEATRAALQAEQEAHAAQREEIAGAHAQRDAAAVELQNAQTQLASLTGERDANASEIERLTVSLSEAQERADIAVQRAAELAESAAASEPAEAAESASAAGADSQALEDLKAQLSRDAQTHTAAMNEARENMKKWSEYANGLKQQLVQSNEKTMVAHARSAGEAALTRRLVAELGEARPEHELLRKDVQQQLIVDAINAQLERQGYRYDVTTGVVSKLNTENATA